MYYLKLFLKKTEERENSLLLEEWFSVETEVGSPQTNNSSTGPLWRNILALRGLPLGETEQL